MVRINSPWIKLPILLLLVFLIVWVLTSIPSSNSRAVGIIGLILLTEAYFFGIDTVIVKRIVKMKPRSRIINGSYYIVVGVALLIFMALGAFAFYQWALGIFVCLVGVSILLYHPTEGSNSASAQRSPDKSVSVSASTVDKGTDAKSVTKESRGLGAVIRKHELHTYLISLGSDLAVTALFFGIFALIDYGTAFLLFFLGCVIRFVGDRIAKLAGVIKEVPLPEETVFE